jgi:hypothetical protein
MNTFWCIKWFLLHRLPWSQNIWLSLQCFGLKLFSAWLLWLSYLWFPYRDVHAETPCHAYTDVVQSERRGQVGARSSQQFSSWIIVCLCVSYTVLCCDSCINMREVFYLLYTYLGGSCSHLRSLKQSGMYVHHFTNIYCIAVVVVAHIVFHVWCKSHLRILSKLFGLLPWVIAATKEKLRILLSLCKYL